MVCYNCGKDTQVFNSRSQKRSNQVWRRRQCTSCGTVFSTTEAIDYSKSMFVGGRPGSARLAAFERDKLLLSIYKSLTHRPSALSDAGGLCTTIVAKLAVNAQNGVVDRQIIINTTVVALTRFDTLAAQHYQALHKD